MDLFGSSAPRKKPKKNGSGPGSVVISTLKRRAATPSSSSSSPAHGSSEGRPAAANALPAEFRARIEAARAAERERQIDAEAEAQVRTKNAATQKKSKHKVHATGRKPALQDLIDSEEESSGAPKRKRGRKDAGNRKTAATDDDEDDLFGSGGEGSDRDEVSRPSLTSRSASRSAMSHRSSPAATAYTYLGRSGVQQPYLVARTAITSGQPEKKVVANQQSIASAQLVEAAMKKKPRNWGPFFKDLPCDEESGGPPRCVLEYPGMEASEEFILMVSRDADEYDPISDLLRSVYVMVKYYLSAEQRRRFGELDELETSSAAGHIWSGPVGAGDVHPSTGSDTPVPATPTSESVPGTPAHVAQTMAAMISPTSESSTPLQSTSLAGVANGALTSILRSFTKSRNRRSGRLFLDTVHRFNEAIIELRTSGSLKTNLHSLVASQGVPDDVWLRIQDQAYARTVAPRVDELSGYRSFSDNVYGELTPRFMSEISQLCGLQPQHTMLDLGCGVGNLVVQAALQVGCTSLGVEAMPTPADLGAQQLAEAKTRWTQMWDLSPFVPDEPRDVAVWQGDFLEDEEVRRRMKDVDLIIVNNYAFTPPLNQSLSLLFLDLKDGAKIVSLKPFVPADFRLTERTLGSSSAILRVEEREYGRGMVSWTERGGKYYIATVDRSALQAFLNGTNGSIAGTNGTPRKKARHADLTAELDSR
ncbi:unnamed protein product [Parajaminaea phylloscopi]